MRGLLVLTLLTLATSAHAGGTSERVIVTKLERLGATAYVLVVIPRPTGTDSADPYMGRCKLFAVHGDYKRLRGSWFLSDDHATREAHLKALALLERAARSRDLVSLGWMGTGFVAIDEKDPCKVRSRSLAVFGEGVDQQVISFHDAM